MSSLTVYDHYSDQVHESVGVFLNDEHWSSTPWNSMNVPIYLCIETNDDGFKEADVIVYLPRKSHIKHVKVVIRNDEEMDRFRRTFKGVGELYEEAVYNLEAFANGGVPDDVEDGCSLVLYYWKKMNFIKETNTDD